MLSPERPWEDPHHLDAITTRRRRTWHGVPCGFNPESVEVASPTRRSTWHQKSGRQAKATGAKKLAPPSLLPPVPEETDPLLPSPTPKSGPRQPTLRNRAASLRRHYGLSLLALIFAVQHVMKGFVLNFTVVAELFLYRSYNVPATEIQVYQALTGLPWAMKPVCGLVSDVFPVFGYKKAPYALVTSVAGAAAFFAIGSLTHESMSVGALVFCLFLQTLQVSTADVLSQGTFTQRVQETSSPRLRADLLSFVWSGGDIGALAAVISSGLVIQSAGPRMAYLIATVPAFALLFLVVRGCYEERWVSKSEIDEVRKRFMEQWEACVLTVLMLICAAMLVYSSALATTASAHLAVAVSIALTVLISFTFVLSPVLAKMNAFNFVFSLASLSIEAACFYFCTDDVSQYPEGPHLSIFFYSTVRGAVQFVFSLIGIYSYQHLSQGWTYRRWMVIATFLFAAANVPNVLMFRRDNVRFGVPDWIWILCSTALTSVFDKWKWMPRVVGMSYMCPKGMEVTMFALLMGCNNLGWAISANLGAVMLQQLGIRPQGHTSESHQFENLWLASVWGCVALPVVVLLLSRLLPDAHMDENLIGDAQDAATAGSIFRRLTQHVEQKPRTLKPSYQASGSCPSGSSAPRPPGTDALQRTPTPSTEEHEASEDHCSLKA